MSINKNGPSDFEIECDECGEIIEYGFDEWGEAVEWKRQNKHLCQAAKSPDGEWFDLCASCVQQGYARAIRNGESIRKSDSRPTSSVQGKPPTGGLPGRSGHTEEKKYVPPPKPDFGGNNPFEGYSDIK